MTYSPQSWQTNDLITADRLNRVEAGLADISAQVTTAADAASAAGSIAKTANTIANASTPLTVQATAPDAAKGGLWLDTTTGQLNASMNRGATGVVNLATNPSFEKGTGDRAEIPVLEAQHTWRFGSFNVRSAALSATAPTNTEQPWSTRKTAVAADITASEATIVGLQEADALSNGTVSANLSPSSDLTAALGESWAYVTYALSGLSILFNEGVWEQVSGGQMADINDADHLGGETATRQILWATFRHRTSGQRIIFATTHVPTGPEAVAGDARRYAVGNIIHLLNELRATDPLPVVLAGDFNTLSGDDDGNVFDLLDAAGYRDVKGDAATVTQTGLDSISDFVPDMTNNRLGRWMDRVVVTDELKAVKAGLAVRYADGLGLPLAQPIGSDHLLSWGEVVFMPELPRPQGMPTASDYLAGGGSAAFLSEKHAASGTKSVCVVSTASSGTAASYYPSGHGNSASSFGRYLGLFPGRSYAVSVKVLIEAAYTGTVHETPIGVNVGYNTGSSTEAGHLFWDLAAASAKNQPDLGWQTVTINFTVPSDASNVFLRLMNGVDTAGYQVWFDDLMIVEGASPDAALASLASVGYIDGDQPGVAWAGGEHESQSRYAGPSWVRLGGGV